MGPRADRPTGWVLTAAVVAVGAVLHVEARGARVPEREPERVIAG